MLEDIIKAGYIVLLLIFIGVFKEKEKKKEAKKKLNKKDTDESIHS